jgi:drug/metabolite transporter (DMT)-like permease
VSADAGLFPLVGARGASITALALFITLRKGWAPIPGDGRRSVVVAGVLDCAANSCYLLALGEGSFVWVAAITSMSPVSTVLLARIRLHELMSRTQILGIAGAVLAVVLVSVGAEL